MDMIVSQYSDATGAESEKYERMMWKYATFSRDNQRKGGCQPYVPGNCEAVGGPGEPKYEVNGEVYKAPWGRVQNDGPALRASAIMRFVGVYLAKGGNKERVRELYDSRMPTDSVIKTDLEYVAHHWYVIY